MAQPKPHSKNQQNDRDCASTVDSCGYSANHSALSSCATGQEILASVGPAQPATTFSSDQAGKILHLFPQSAPSSVPQHIRDIETLKLSELKQAYQKEHTSWRSRKTYALKVGIAFHPPWNDFRNYLRELGPIPADGYTLDKINPKKGYVPENVRWASKETQTHNRHNTIWLTNDGKRLPLGVWAKKTGQPESTLRNRRNRGWPDENIITGTAPEKTTLPPANHPWPIGHAEPWERRYQAETGGSGSRFKFMGHLTAKRMIELSEQADSLCFPNDHNPTPNEKEALNHFTKAHDYWMHFWRHVQRERVKQCGKPFISLVECKLMCS